MKICSKCGVPKPESEFYPRSEPGKFFNSCKLCKCAYGINRYAENPEPAKEASKRHRLENPEKAKEYGMNWRTENHERVKETRKRQYEEDPESVRDSNNRWRKKNPETVRKMRKRWQKENKIVVNMRNRINKVVKGSGCRKSAATTELIGCPWVWLEVHIESLFKPGMSWKNYGPVWHVDHVKPCAAFNLLDPEQQKICFHWTNLQPLFAEDNLKKGDTYERC